MQRICFVSFNITLKGIKIELDWVHIVAEWSEPTCYCNTQVFLSFVNFTRHLISSFSHLPKLMLDMVKEGNNSYFS